MATQQSSSKDQWLDHKVAYSPLGVSDKIELSPRHVYAYFAAETKSGVKAPIEVVEQFLKVCQTQRLNPWARDAWIVGYDSKSGPKFSVITSYQSLAKRAEANEHYRGVEYGLIVEADGEIVDVVGSFVPKGNNILGAWAKVYRSDRDLPFVVRINFTAYDKGNEFWRTSPEWMITKCARAAAMREAFPTDLGGLYIEHEFQRQVTMEDVIAETERSTKRLADRMAPAPVPEVTPAKQSPRKVEAVERGDAYEPSEEELEEIKVQERNA